MLIIIVVIITALFVMRMVYRGEKDITADWKTYQNDKFGFEIKYPSGWQIYASERSYDNIVNIYKTGKPPFTHHSNVAQVSIFPEGLGTEGRAGEITEVVEDLTLAEEKTVGQYILNNKKPFGYVIRFENTPQNFNDFGFIWASAEIKNQEFICHDKTKNMDICEPLADGLDVVGDIDDSEWIIVKEILSTFKFIE